jgi:hypothetical protein
MSARAAIGALVFRFRNCALDHVRGGTVFHRRPNEDFPAGDANPAAEAAATDETSGCDG